VLLSRRNEEAPESEHPVPLDGPNDKIVVDGFDDPKVKGVACHISRAQTGGVKGAIGIAEDTSDASIACRQIGRSAWSANSRTANRFR